MAPEQLFVVWILAPILGEVIAVGLLIWIHMFPAPTAKYEVLKERVTLNCVIAIILLPILFITSISVWNEKWIECWNRVGALLAPYDYGNAYANIYAAQDIPANVPITRDMLIEKPDPGKRHARQSLGIESLIGQRSSINLPKGSNIRQSDLVPTR